MLKALSFSFIVFVVLACGKDEVFDIHENLLFKEEQWYGVVDMSYLPVYSQMGKQGSIQIVLRQNDLVVVDQIRHYYNTKEKSWQDFYFITTDKGKQGWVESSTLLLYDYRISALQQIETED